MINFIKNNKWFLVFFALFVFTRFLGLGQIYHQDEYRWATIVNPVFEETSGVHPPITRLALSFVGRILGYDNLRAVPIIFSIFNLWLIYLISLHLSRNKKVALIAVGLFVVNIYSFIANLQIDIDGAILPFFILLSYYSYLHIREKRSLKWLAIFTIAVIGGFLTKVSYLLFISALIADQILLLYIAQRKSIKQIFLSLWPWLIGLMAMIVVFYYFYATRLRAIIDYAEHFNSLNFASRAYFDLTFKFFKSFVWLSPLLALPVVYGFFKKDLLEKYRLWFIYLFINLVFYLVLFDFSTLAVERYFMFLIIPSVLISAEAVYNLFRNQGIRKNVYIIATVVFVIFSFFILSLPHNILPLNPKEAYLGGVKSFKFNFLIPFTGGSGPSGFYFSALFILVAWVTACLSMLRAVLSENKKNLFLAVFIVFGIGYNLIFSAEYLSGFIYGSVDKVSRETIEYVNSNKNIKGVITYYDIGAYYLRLSGKYDSRFYTAPKRDYTQKIQNYRGQYMIVDFPAIEKAGRYWPLIARCPLVKKFQDKKIESYIFNCHE